MVVETIYRLGTVAGKAVAYFSPNLFEVADYIAYKFKIDRPTKHPNAIPFVNTHCNDHNPQTKNVTRDVIRTIVIDNKAITKMKETVQGAPFVTFLHHEPPIAFPGATKVDLLSVRGKNHIFHIILLSNQELIESAIAALEEATYDKPIYGKNPTGLLRFFSEKYKWYPTILNIMPLVAEGVNKAHPNLNDIAHLAFGGKMCQRATVFSAHITPSHAALSHREQAITAVHLFAASHGHRIAPLDGTNPPPSNDAPTAVSTHDNIS